MIRVFVTQLILFLLPFLLYGGYLFLTRKMNKQAFIDAPRYWLIMAGIALSLGGFVVLSQINNNPVGGTYIPTHYENGVLVPGQVKGSE
ncbi:hypothetical protein SAMN04515647_1703 [Cohaesibacter sp. ES.047]|uniref:DUF6111 family protein n=1 Tax=Cohaesibacter sp. ES.047 TaxID=1798205 RepID=UPI000BB7EA3C|nr:DUF6111 family protein [Cohaesibacter sp. ES.047]SNY91480.1 hypothetical protein SAMN04515647_1703 [Cohaesibacter sp. ES.047]